MNQIRALVRIGLILGIILVGMLAIFLFGWLPIRYRGARLPISIIRFIVRILLWLFNVKPSCTEPEKLANYQGLLFPNHVSFLDVLVILAETPARFLAAIEIRQRPGLGWLTASADTIYVIREQAESRKKARNDLAQSFVDMPYPPIVLYPEGKLGSGDKLLPFRHGAFEIASQNSIPYLPCAIRYSHPEMVIWHGGSGESMTAAVWRFAQFVGPLYTELIPLEIVYPTPDDDPALLAQETQQAIAEVMGFPTEQ